MGLIVGYTKEKEEFDKEINESKKISCEYMFTNENTYVPLRWQPRQH